MAALFPPWSNTAAKLGVVAAASLGFVGIVGPMIYVRTPYSTGQREPVDQPVQFDHRHHVADDGIACLYCHRGAEDTPNAGIPETEICMGCHSQVLSDTALLEPVRRSWFSQEPIRWVRVHRLPDFVYFDHGSHTRAGVDCAQCHGRVEHMARVFQAAPLTMKFCLDCHRGHDRSITRLTTCTACHR